MAGSSPRCTQWTSRPWSAGRPPMSGSRPGTGELFAPIDVLNWTYTPTTWVWPVMPPRSSSRNLAAADASVWVRGTSTELSAARARRRRGAKPDLHLERGLGSRPGPPQSGFRPTGRTRPRSTTATFDQAGDLPLPICAHGRRGRVGYGRLIAPLRWCRLCPRSLSPQRRQPCCTGPRQRIAARPTRPVWRPDAVRDCRFVAPHSGWTRIHLPPHQRVTLAPPIGTGPVTIRASNGTVTGSATVVVVDRPSENAVGELRHPHEPTQQSVNPDIGVSERSSLLPKAVLAAPEYLKRPMNDAHSWSSLENSAP